MSTVDTEVITYQFTVPGTDPAAFGGTSHVSALVRLFADDGVTIELSHYLPGGAVSLSLEQFNQLRAKIFEVTGRVV